MGWEMKGWPLFAVYARIVAGNTRGRAGTCAPGSKDRDGRRGMNERGGEREGRVEEEEEAQPRYRYVRTSVCW